MWEVVLSGEVEDYIQQYIEMYQDYFLDTFSHTGIWNEEAIRSQYIANARQLRIAMEGVIFQKLSREILGHSVLDEETKSVTLQSSSRMIVVNYIEDIHTKTRLVGSIRIFRRK